MNQFINDISDSFSDLLKAVVGKTDFLLNVYKNASESTESHTQLSRLNENALCNLVTDSMREIGNADVSIMNAGTVLIDINPGNITYQDVINTMPFSNDVLVKSIKGQNILEALEFGVRTLPGETTRFPQVSGISYKVDTSINSSVVVDENEVFHSLGKENRVYDFIYIPFKESKKNEGLINAGYAFINFVHPKHILKFYSFFHGKHLKLKTSGKVCIITFASRQGANIKYKGFEQSVNDKYMYFSDTKNHFQLLTD
jgi:hypothetical protein